MANYSTTASVVLEVNGQQAQQMLSKLESDAKKLEKGIEKAAMAGDKVTMKKLQRELNQTNRTMQQLKGSSNTVDAVLRRLDKATPKELRSTLTQLNRQLQGMQRGTAAWDAQVTKIKAVKAELQKVNATLTATNTKSKTVGEMFQSAHLAIMGWVAAIAGFIAGAKKAVEAFAAMQTEEINVTKETGLAMEEVVALNEELKKIDTSTGREELNKFAQQAGRSGVSGKEGILEFVKAADQIMMTMGDIGEEAPLTIAKLTEIFGDRQTYGTEESMLKVASSINEITRSSSIAAPQLTQFIESLGRTGAQAGMTIPEIAGIAAVLEDQQLPLEKSAKAISQVLIHMMQDPAKYAKAAGLEVKEFTKQLQENGNEALTNFLEAMNKKGGIGALSSTFKDLGDSSASVITTLSSLSSHVDDLKAQQAVANRAFEDGTSVTNEYNQRLNSAQGELGRAKQATHELWRELGERLQPVYMGLLSTMRSLMSGISSMIDFLGKNKATIITLTATIAAWTIALNLNIIATKAKILWSKTLQALAVTKRVVVLALSAGYNALTGNMDRATAATKRLNTAMKGNLYGVIATVLALVIAKIVDYVSETNEANKATKEWEASLTSIGRKSAEYSQKELARLDMLYEAAIDEAKSKDERKAAAERLMKIYPDYFQNMTAEQIMVGEAETAYKNLTNAIIQSANARAAEDKIVDLGGKILDETEALDAATAKLNEKKKNLASAQWNYQQAQYRGADLTLFRIKVEDAREEVEDAKKEVDKIKGRINTIKAKQGELAETYKLNVNAVIAEEDETVPPVIPPHSGGTGGSSTTDKFAKEKAAREKAEAEARISYARGLSDFGTYTAAMDKAAYDFYKAQLAHTDLTELERLKIQADYYEAQKKQTENQTAASLASENARYQEQTDALRKQYLTQISDFSLTNEERKKINDIYIESSETAELAHLLRIRNLYAEGSEKWLEADRVFQEKQLASRKRHVDKMEEEEKRLKEIKEKYFGDSKEDKSAKYQSAMDALDTVYNGLKIAAENDPEELARLKKAYDTAAKAIGVEFGQTTEKVTTNGVKGAIEASAKWLESDGGKAFTKSFEAIVAQMSAIFSSLSTLMQAELDIQTAAIDKKYDKEISRAQGNSYLVAKLEKQKEAEIAKAKSEASKKQYAMQVIQAVAQTAQNAIAAYGSAAAIPMVGYIIAPIAAAMAAAAGMIQVAAIKKQQQAAESQGYADGGFTIPGRKDQPAGVVHAGEWVASQALVNNPQTRPIINALEYMQRNNTVGSLTAADVSRAITAPIAVANSASTQSGPVVISQTDPSMSEAVQRLSSIQSPLSATLDRLTDRLNQPFVTVNTVTGDYGMQKAQSDYERMMKNKSPKLKK